MYFHLKIFIMGAFLFVIHHSNMRSFQQENNELNERNEPESSEKCKDFDCITTTTSTALNQHHEELSDKQSILYHLQQLSSDDQRDICTKISLANNLTESSIATQRTHVQEKYLGCFKDTPERMFKKLYTLYETCSAKKCVNLCRNEGFIYAGLEYGYECYCGNRFPSLPSYPGINENLCQMACPGDANEKCGGDWAMSVYETGNERINLTESSITIQRIYTPQRYLGCFRDTSERIFKKLLTLDETSVTKCVKFCRDEGFVYAGLENGHECYCGNEFPSLQDNPSINESECQTECPGNASEKCGGGWAMSLYRTGNEIYVINHEGKHINQDPFDSI